MRGRGKPPAVVITVKPVKRGGKPAPKAPIAATAPRMPPEAMEGVSGATPPPTPLPPSPGPPMGATDGLGAGQGGLAIHPSLKGHNIGGYEPKHSSRTR
jgi:hypothetical protein